MNVQMAKVAGFCMGVRRAMDMALEASQKAKPPVYTYGPLIHNPSALTLLEARGVKILRQIPVKGHGTVLVRAHGIPPEEKNRLINAGFNIIDATCPRVIKVQMLARHYARKGLKVVLIGDKGHPEVMGIMGHAQDKAILVSSHEDLERLLNSGVLDPKQDEKTLNYVILAQTTQDRERFEQWSQAILRRYPLGRVFNTICNSTHKRQDEVRRLASEMDVVVVVGGKQSANTRRLAEIVEECGKPVMAIETEEDLDWEELSKYEKVGITAGASTPNWVINRVVREIQAFPGAHEASWHRILYQVVRFLHESNLWTALSGGALCWSCMLIISGGRVGNILTGAGLAELGKSSAAPGHLLSSVLVAACYIYAMHTLNRLIDREAGEFNDPLRAKFLAKNRELFILSSSGALSLSIALAWNMGIPAFVFLILLSLFGVLYTMPLLPGGRSRRSLKDLPGSKTLFVALAWASVCVLVPLNMWPSEIGLTYWVLFVIIGLLVYLRTALLEVLDVQGDRIVGKETMAVLIGEHAAVRLVVIVALLLSILALATAITGIVPRGVSAMVVPATYTIWLSRRFTAGRIGQNLRLETMVEAGPFLLLGSCLLLARFLLIQ